MNIFILSKDPIEAAQMQCDRHVVKMVLETAQLLCSIYPNGEAPYKRTYYNHPCAKWTRESFENYSWLYKHGKALSNEYKYRYNKEHKSERVIDYCFNIAAHNLSLFDFYQWMTPFNKCMPDQYKVDDVVRSYRNYYIGAKKDMAKWTKRQPPQWYVDGVAPYVLY